MPIIEILAYYPINMGDFLFFCINGAPDGNGSWLPDEFGRKKTGVFDWLYGRGVPEAHFYTSAPEDPVPVFVATVQKPETGPMPWLENIPGFEALVVSDGQVGLAGQFPPFNQPIATVAPRPDLDAEFENGRGRFEPLLRSLRQTKEGSLSADALRAALRGDAGTDLSSLLAAIKI
jgi:hypothetical protein